jgi:hypothetical protein
MKEFPAYFLIDSTPHMHVVSLARAVAKHFRLAGYKVTCKKQDYKSYKITLFI